MPHPSGYRLPSHLFRLVLFLSLFLPLHLLAQVSGTVTDSVSNMPVSGALVTLQGGSPQAITDSAGQFSLNVSGSGLVIVAAGKGFFHQSATLDAPATGVMLAMDPVPVTDNAGYILEDPDFCGGCHPKQLAEWQGTPMARAGFNSWVHDIYDGNGTPGGMGGFVYTRDSVFAGSNPNSECASCHQPQHWIENPFAAMDANLVNPVPGVEHGVSCEVCHKVADVDVTKINYPGIFPGAVTFNRPDPGIQVQYGVLADVSYEIPGLMRASYQPQLRAEVCAACHQDAADPNEDHTFSGVISEPTYLEWWASSYADPMSPNFADCVDCHMGPSSDNAVCSNIPPPGRPVESVRSHQILGTTPEYLDNAVDLVLEVVPGQTEFQVNVDVINDGTGHHVPTGVTVRNMILLVEAWRDGDDPLTNPLTHTGTQLVHDLGGIGDPAQGYYAGLPGKFFAKVNHDASGTGPTFFTDATGILFDNRIPALQTDSTSYTFAYPVEQGPIRVRARLIYRRAFRFLVDAKQWTEDGHGNPLEDVQPPHYGHLMELRETVLASPALQIPTLGYPALSALIALLCLCGGIVLRQSGKPVPRINSD